MSAGTITFYVKKLRLFCDYCTTQAITRIDQVDQNLIRQYLLYLEGKGHNPGGVHAAYRTLKTFLRWWEQEVEPDDWRNPIKKIKPPRLALEPLEPIDLGTVKALVDACPLDTFTGIRDRAIFLALLDTGSPRRNC